jgi:hypothetical protein
MGQAIGDILPMAVGVAISPAPIIAIVLMLGTPRARSNGRRSLSAAIMTVLFVVLGAKLLGDGIAGLS